MVHKWLKLLCFFKGKMTTANSKNGNVALEKERNQVINLE